MEIRNGNFNHKSIGFGDSLVIKVKNPGILNALAEKDCSEWSGRQNPEFRYTHISGDSPDMDGLFRGLIVDEAEKDALHGAYGTKNEIALLDRIVSASKTIELKTMKQLESLLQLKTVNAMLKRFVK